MAPEDPWNDSLKGDYLWTAGNVGEAVPDVMTPATWSLVQRFIRIVMASSFTTPYPPIGNIGGRFYMNPSTIATITAAMGVPPRRIRGVLEQAFGKLPPDVELPVLPLPRIAYLRTLWPVMRAALARQKAWRARTPAFLAEAPARCQAIRASIATADLAGLRALWDATVEPYMQEACYVQEAGRTDSTSAVWLPPLLKRLAGEEAAVLLLGGGAEMASLGPVVGLSQVAAGTLDPAVYLQRFGHRSPHEFEISTPRPAEDPSWLARQQVTVDAQALVAAQEARRQAAWNALGPVARGILAGPVARAAAAARNREAARSEVIRAFWALRAFYLRAGELTGAAVFFLPIDELLRLLDGDASVLAAIPARQEAYERYKALPPYPALIRGAFAPFSFAAPAVASQAIKGFPGAAGVVEGVVRLALTIDEAQALRPGEVLVTLTTNVGWTPLFPRAAAVVTDIGAPLSHAAIVARELGIPAVVGCGNATRLLATGERVRVDGAAGTVERLG